MIFKIQIFTINKVLSIPSLIYACLKICKQSDFEKNNTFKIIMLTLYLKNSYYNHFEVISIITLIKLHEILQTEYKQMAN